MNIETLFFAALIRRKKYDTKEDGSYLPYSQYRVAIAEDCAFRCVYCDTHEESIGGREAMEIDHFRPWQKNFGHSKVRKFEHLKNEPLNLVHACSVCNGFKWSHWPTENPDLAYDHEKGWIEPFHDCRGDFLEVRSDGTVVPTKSPAQYQIIKLRLNRPLLQRQRELRIMMSEFEKTAEKWRAVIAKNNSAEHVQTATEALHLFDMVRALIKY